MKLTSTIKSLAPVLVIGAAAQSFAQANLSENVFSLDIGSDTEISDPAGGAGELADPGDVYASSSVVGSLAGVPHLDDFNLFGATDPAPPQGVVASAVPVGTAGLYPNFFDLDGYDSVETRLDQLDLNPQSPLAAPIWRTPGVLTCVARARNLLISFNDDSVLGWGQPNPPRVPTEGPSPMGNTHGSSVGQDEVISIEIGVAGGFPAALVAFTPTASETDVHVDLGPNPMAGMGQADDDDIDALDRTDRNVCNVHLFSADAEARLNLVPGWIYQRAPGSAPAPIITDVHLGIPQVADIDAFELVWLPHPSNQQEALALAYSVDPDDPMTPPDESGGLIPSNIYASFLDGSSFVLVAGPPNGFDDVDAIATGGSAAGPDDDGDGIPNTLDNCLEVANPDQRDTDGDGYGNICDQDHDQDCTTGISDLAYFRTRFFSGDPDADYDGDGTVNLVDLAIMRRNFFMRPGPSGVVSTCD